MLRAGSYFSIIITLLLACVHNASAQNAQTGQIDEQPTPILPKFDPGINSVAIPWEPISEKDILWKKRVWRRIDATNPRNYAAFGYQMGTLISSSLLSVLASGVMSDKIKAYADDRFTNVLPNDVFMELLKEIGPGGIMSWYRIKEDWLYTNTTPKGKMIVRIVGIAPEIEAADSEGRIVPQPLFWIYYPDCRDFLAGFKSGYKDEHAVPYNWNEYFEGRRFNSDIEKVKTMYDKTNKETTK